MMNKNKKLIIGGSADLRHKRAIKTKKRLLSTESRRGKQINLISNSVRKEINGSNNRTSSFFRFNALIYCQLFPSSYEFDKDNLLQLWIAAGFLLDGPVYRTTGTVSFEDCISKGYFQFSGTNLVTLKPMYTFKVDSDSQLSNLLGLRTGNKYALVQYFSDLKCLDCQVISHLALSFHSVVDFDVLAEVSRFKQLQTLLFLQGGKSGITRIPQGFFLSIPLLHTLDLSRTSLIELPSSVGNLTHLQYLNVSDTPIKCLPETIGRLRKLQTLKLRGCTNISALPTRFRMLLSLRHLEFDVLQCNSMPPGIGALTNLQTLWAFIVDYEEERSIQQLKNLNQLSGSLCVSRLENVLTKEYAIEACLSEKSQLTKLELNWSELVEENDIVNWGVLAFLAPNICLQELQISCFGGFAFPSWISSERFSKLVRITLFNCENCLYLPSLGNLPSLKFLDINNFNSLKMIDPIFYGRRMSTAFPKLEYLTIANMFNLEEWGIYLGWNFPRLLYVSVMNCPKLHNLHGISCIRSLQSLEISHCELVPILPSSLLRSSLKELIVKECPLITKFFDEDQNLLQIAYISTVWLDDQEISFGQKVS